MKKKSLIKRPWEILEYYFNLLSECVIRLCLKLPVEVSGKLTDIAGC